MQSSLRNRLKHAAPVKLQAGGGIRFGFMRQNNLSGRMLNVTDVMSYVFDDDCFASYQLRDEETDISVILVEEPNPMESYMAISFQLKEKWCASLFAKLPPKQWFKLPEEESLSVDMSLIVMPQGWLVDKYTAVLTTKGRKFGGDMRRKLVADLDDKKAEAFEYVLLVSENGEYALEAEKFDNGRIKVMATVYRPMSDIIETTSFNKPYIVADNTSAEGEQESAEQVASPSFDKLVADKLAQEQENHLEIEAKPEPKGEAKATEEVAALKAEPVKAGQVAETVQAAVVASQPEIATATMATAVTAPVAGSGDMLSCNSMLAARLLDEALRNKLSLEDIIRKVIDLPRESRDVVYVPFALSDSEQHALAKRYGVADVSDVQQRIVQELKDFAGVK